MATSPVCCSFNRNNCAAHKVQYHALYGHGRRAIGTCDRRTGQATAHDPEMDARSARQLRRGEPPRARKRRAGRSESTRRHPATTLGRARRRAPSPRVEPPASRTPKLTRNGQGAALWTGEAGGKGMLVAGTEPPDVVELWDWTLAPGERHDSEAHSDGTRELLHVQEGTVIVEVDGNRYDLAPGDALSFYGDAAHAYINSTDNSARFSLTVFEPDVGTAH